MNLYSTLCLVLSLCSVTISLNILAVLPYHGKSHSFVFKKLLKGLAYKGHNVTVISHFPEKNPPKDYHDISLAGTIDAIEDNMPVERNYWTIIRRRIFIAISGKQNCEIMLQNKEVQQLVADKRNFDVVLIEQFNSDCGFGLAYKLGAPVVGLTTHVLMPWHYDRLGVPSNPAYVSHHFLGGGDKPTFFEKIERVIFDVYVKTLYYLVSLSNQKDIEKYIGPVPPLEELARDMKVLLTYHNFVLTGSRLFPANVIEVGGYHVGESKPLTGALKRFIDEAQHGVIYISFGSVVKSATLPTEKLQAILGLMKSMPQQRFVWKWEDESTKFGLHNLFVSKWLPQVDILAHPNVIAFFSHAGMLGTTEAIHHGVPIVALPVLGDQLSNAEAIESSGLGVQIHVNDLTKETLLKSFKTVMEPGFQAKVKELSQSWKDRPSSPMETAIHWIEFVAKYPNATYRTAAADLPFYLYFNLDLVLFFATIIFTTFYILRLCCRSLKLNNNANKIITKTVKAKKL